MTETTETTKMDVPVKRAAAQFPNQTWKILVKPKAPFTMLSQMKIEIKHDIKWEIKPDDEDKKTLSPKRQTKPDDKDKKTSNPKRQIKPDDKEKRSPNPKWYTATVKVNGKEYKTEFETERGAKGIIEDEILHDIVINYIEKGTKSSIYKRYS